MANDGCLKSEEFLVKVGDYFKVANERKLSVRLTLKRLVEFDDVEVKPEFDTTNQPSYDISAQAQSIKADNESANQYSLLVRASYGSHKAKTKCSTIISADTLDKFWQDYSLMVRSNMEGLVKKKKKRSTKGSTKSKKSVKN